MSELLKLENQLCHRFYTLSNAFTRAYRPLLKALDITYPQYVTLMALWETDNVTIAELLDKTAIDGGAMSLILKKLEDKGFLMITKDKTDQDILDLIDEPIIDFKEQDNLKKIESLEKELINNLDENSYLELIKLKSQLNRD